MMIWLAFVAALQVQPEPEILRYTYPPTQSLRLEWADLRFDHTPMPSMIVDAGELQAPCVTTSTCNEAEKATEQTRLRSLKQMQVEGFMGPQAAAEYQRVLHGLVWDIVRNGGGVTIDIWSTRYALRQPNVEELNGLIFDDDTLLAVKAAAFLGVTLICHEMRVRGHHTWATWISRFYFIGHLALTGNNLWIAHKAKQ